MTATPTATVAATPTPADGFESVVIADENVGTITVTIPDSGWDLDGGIVFSRNDDDTGILTISGDLFVYGDPCRWSSTRPESPTADVDEIVAGLGSQASRDASEPVGINVGGHSGKAITVHVPDDAVFSECDEETFGLFTTFGEPDSPGRYNQGPGQIDELWVVDVNGVPVAFDLIYWPDTPQDVIDEMHAIVESAIFGEAPTPTASTGSTPIPTASVPQAGTLVIVGRIVTMDEPGVAEALLIEDGSVTAVGTRDDVLALAGDGVRVIDIGQNVAYPGFIDAHAHWIGNRSLYGMESPAEAMQAALSHGWTSISEQWVDDSGIAELEGLAADRALPLRVDAYLALNGLDVDDSYGDWYADRQPGSVDDHLRVRGLKIHLDSGSGAILYWEPAELTETIGRANAAGWQVSVHAVSTEAVEMALDAFEVAIGPTGPNPLHHRIEHALQVTDDQLARLVAMDLTTVVQLDGVAVDWVLWAESLLAHPGGDEIGRDYQSEGVDRLGRWRDFVDAGLHVAGSSDLPWFLIDFDLTEDIGRPVDEIAGGMDGRAQVFQEMPEWMLDQLLTAEEGLRAVTVEAAWALGDEGRRGHLAPGTMGDVTILSGDATASTPDEIRALEVIATIVNGIVAYCSDTEVCGPD